MSAATDMSRASHTCTIPRYCWSPTAVSMASICLMSTRPPPSYTAENAGLGVSSLEMSYCSSVCRKLLTPVHCWVHIQPMSATIPSCWANCPAWTATNSWSAVAVLGLFGSRFTLFDDRKSLHAVVPITATDAARLRAVRLRIGSPSLASAVEDQGEHERA